MPRVFIKNFIFAVCASSLFILSSAISYAQPKDPQFSLIAQGQYFDLYACPGVDVGSLIQKLDFDVLRPEFLSDIRAGGDMRSMLAKIIDAIYLETSDILDIHMYSFKANLGFLRDYSAVAQSFKAKTRIVLKGNAPSFYLHDDKTIYISTEDLTLGMLGHEMAHAIISHYFVVPPPTKVQEVLSGYVDYSFQKKARKRNF